LRALRAVQSPCRREQFQQFGSSSPVGHRWCRCSRADEVTTRCQVFRELAEKRSQAPANPIAHYRCSHMAAECERHTRLVQAAVGRKSHPQQLAVEATTAAQRCEVGPAAARIDQALSRCRPLRRRAFTIARPARVDMRWRKPCRRARLRLCGWYVRFTLQPPGGSGRGQCRELRCGGRSVPGPRPESTDSLGALVRGGTGVRRSRLAPSGPTIRARQVRSIRAQSHATGTRSPLTCGAAAQ